MQLKENEYGQFYTGYVKLSSGKPLMDCFKHCTADMINLLNSISDEQSLYRYEEGKWSIKEVIGHIIDTERIFSYRALALARGEENPIMGYDHNQYVATAGFDRLSLENFKLQYRATREATLTLFSNFDEQEMLRAGVVNGSNFTVRGIGYVIAGHEMHHQKILKDRYLPYLPS
jgi:hypothetical protein